MRVLLVGGSGFVGQSIVADLLPLGYKIGIYSPNCVGDFDGCACYRRDLLLDETLSSLLKGYQAVIYLITSSTPRSSMDNKSLTYERDIPMLLKLLDCCKKSGVRRVIYASTGGTICVPNGACSRESEDVWPITHYGIGKLLCEKILTLYNKQYHMENISLRLANLYGIRQLKEGGKGVITSFTKNILCGETIALYGDGSTVRDFLLVDYAAEAFRLALEWNFDETITPLFNVGSGVALKLSRVISIISETAGKPAIVNRLPNNSFDTPYNCLDIKKAETHLGYHPPASPEQDIAAYVHQVKSALQK